MRVLVVFGSKNGGTEGLARAVAAGLAQAGHLVDVQSARDAGDPSSWDAVFVGGALYAFRWQADARRYVQRCADELRERHVWFFSSGPLDDSARQQEIPPTPQVGRLMERVQARGHVTFGGRLAPDAEGLIARSMLKNGKGGDWRALEDATAWGHARGQELSALPAQSPRPARSDPRGTRRLATALCLFTGVTALGGGTALVLAPPDAPGMPPLWMLASTPFETYLVPGLLLLGVIGLGNLSAAILLARRSSSAGEAAFVAGCALLVWITTQMWMLRTAEWLQWMYLVIGVATCAAAARLVIVGGKRAPRDASIRASSGARLLRRFSALTRR
jgi:menaquinone-dependent protoporphyrinogen oxidase